MRNVASPDVEHLKNARLYKYERVNALLDLLQEVSPLEPNDIWKRHRVYQSQRRHGSQTNSFLKIRNRLHRWYRTLITTEPDKSQIPTFSQGPGVKMSQFNTDAECG